MSWAHESFNCPKSGSGCIELKTSTNIPYPCNSLKLEAFSTRREKSALADVVAWHSGYFVFHKIQKRKNPVWDKFWEELSLPGGMQPLLCGWSKICCGDIYVEHGVNCNRAILLQLAKAVRKYSHLYHCSSKAWKYCIFKCLWTRGRRYVVVDCAGQQGVRLHRVAQGRVLSQSAFWFCDTTLRTFPQSLLLCPATPSHTCFLFH